MKSGFSETDPKYQCCCGSTTVKIGATIVGALEIASVAISFLAVLILAFSPQAAQWAKDNGTASPAFLFLVALVVLLIWLAIAIALLVGIKREDPNLLLPWLIKAAISIFVTTLTSLLTLNFFGLIHAALEAWLFYVVFCCRDYFVQKAKANQNLEWDSGPGITIVSDEYRNAVADYGGLDNHVKPDFEEQK